MSSFSVFGYFGLAFGQRTSIRNAKGRDVFYCVYQTSIQCSSGVAIPAELRVYSPPGDDPLAEDTVVFLLAKVYIPTSGKALLDAICLFPVPGDPSDDKYENSIPDMQFPMVITLGPVLSKAQLVGESRCKVFLAQLSERVWDDKKVTTVEFLFDDSPRWASVSPPNLNSVIHVLGTCADVREHGRLQVRIDSITFNVGPPAIPVGGGDLGGSGGGSPSKRRKFSAFVSPNAMASSSTLTHAPMSSAPQLAPAAPECTANVPIADGDVVSPSSDDTVPTEPDTPIVAASSKAKGKRVARA